MDTDGRARRPKITNWATLPIPRSMNILSTKIPKKVINSKGLNSVTSKKHLFIYSQFLQGQNIGHIQRSNGRCSNTETWEFQR